MDREKVIKGLQEIVDDNWMKTHADWYVSVCSDALAMLKEQETTFEKDGHHIRCTNCGNYWCDTDREGNLFPHNYCPECGRAVKWE